MFKFGQFLVKLNFFVMIWNVLAYFVQFSVDVVDMYPILLLKLCRFCDKFTSISYFIHYGYI